MYFSLSPSFHPAEFNISLPCDEDIWCAKTAQEWYKIAQMPSGYGISRSRILGMNMQTALASLGDTQTPTACSLSLNPFSLFVLIHTILRNIYASRAKQADQGKSEDQIGLLPAGSPDDEIHYHDTSRDTILATQYALHNWLQMWINGPESMRQGESMEEPPFVSNALPFYWLAQVSLMAMQEGSTIFGPIFPNGSSEGRFRLMKEWLDHIRTFVRNGTQVPSQLWDELMKIRLQISNDKSQRPFEPSAGVISFFP